MEGGEALRLRSPSSGPSGHLLPAGEKERGGSGEAAPVGGWGSYTCAERGFTERNPYAASGGEALPK